jgi:SAM-dependent methyltransferase
MTRFVIDGVESGGTFNALDDGRIKQFFEYFPRARTILELGALEGGHTFALASHNGVERVVGVEARASSIEKALFIGSLLGLTNIEFRQANLEHFPISSLGCFDAVFCSGLLYHLPEPWKLVAQTAQVAPSLYIWTVYAREHEATIEIDGLHGREHIEGGPNEPLSGMSPKSIWLTMPSLVEMLQRSGYGRVEILSKGENPNGPEVSLAASLR